MRSIRNNTLAVGLSCAIATFALSATAFAQASNARESIAAGDREYTARQAAASLQHYEVALEAEPRNYEALFKASRQAVDLGEAETVKARREQLYAKGADYAKRAVAVNANDVEGHFALARALGRTALSLGPRDRVKYAIDVREHALAALKLAPNHPGSLHVMGMWNAEVMRLSGVTRMFAKTFLGGKVFGSASWDEAVRYMEQAVAAEPTRAVHHLNLAGVYRDVKRTADARKEYEIVIKTPITDSNDEMYRKTAESELRSLK